MSEPHGDLPRSRRDLLRWQFELTWSLFGYHLAELQADDLLWEPAPHCWTMRRGADGTWVPDWAETEPDPVPVPTIGWVSWHLGWWWSVSIDHARRRTPRERSEIGWPGDVAGVVEWLRGLRVEWLAVLDQLADTDLEATATFPWTDQPELTVAHMISWVNVELMKNVAEIGQLRLIRQSS